MQKIANKKIVGVLQAINHYTLTHHLVHKKVYTSPLFHLVRLCEVYTNTIF
mgnify:CR=1 FL=1